MADDKLVKGLTEAFKDEDFLKKIRNAIGSKEELKLIEGKVAALIPNAVALFSGTAPVPERPKPPTTEQPKPPVVTPPKPPVTNPPSKILRSWENFKITRPVDAKGGKSGVAVEVQNDILMKGYKDEFFYDTGNSQIFRAMTDGATTSGSKYARSEGREMKNGGKDRAAWNFKDDYAAFSGTLAVNEVPKLKDGKDGDLVWFQIHGPDDEPVRAYWDNGILYYVNDKAGKNGETETRIDFKNGNEIPKVGLKEKFSYYCIAADGRLKLVVFADGKEYVSDEKLSEFWMLPKNFGNYFKFGNYLSVNETQGSGVGEVEYFAWNWSHEPGKGLDTYKYGM